MVPGLVLMYLHNTMKLESLGLIFCVTKATASRGINLALTTLYTMFENNKQDSRWKIAWPTPTEMQEFNDMILTNTKDSNEQAVVKGFFGFVDGLNLGILKNNKTNATHSFYLNKPSAYLKFLMADPQKSPSLSELPDFTTHAILATVKNKMHTTMNGWPTAFAPKYWFALLMAVYATSGRIALALGMMLKSRPCCSGET